MAARNLSNREPFDHRLRPARFLHDLNSSSSAHDADFREVSTEKFPNRLQIFVHHKSSMARVHFDGWFLSKLALQGQSNYRPIKLEIRMLQNQFHFSGGSRFAVDGEAGTIRSPAAHTDQHLTEPGAELGFECSLFQK